MATYWVPNLPSIKGFTGHLWRSILIFANCAWYVLSSKHMNMLDRVWGTMQCFFSWMSPKYWNKVSGDSKRVSFLWNYKPTKFQWSMMQIGQDSFIDILRIILGWVYDVISYLICLFYIFFQLRNRKHVLCFYRVLV